MSSKSMVSACAISLLTMLQPGYGQEATAEGLEITGGFLRATPMASGTGAGFLTIHSTGPADRLIAFASPACTTPELHTHINDNGIMRMRQVPAIDIPAGGDAVLQPGGLHLMCIGLTAKLEAGQMVPVTLVFEKAGEVAVTLPVKAIGAMN